MTTMMYSHKKIIKKLGENNALTQKKQKERKAQEAMIVMNHPNTGKYL